MDDKVQYRISTVTACFIVAVALVGDLIQALLDLTGFLAIAADLVTFLVEAILGVWFLILGVNYLDGKRKFSKFFTVLLTTALELVPFIDAIPMLTIGAILLIRATRAEDREKHAELLAQQTQGIRDAEYREVA